MRPHKQFKIDRRSVTPVVGTILLISVLFIVASAIGVVALGYTDDITESTTVAEGSGACSFELNFDPADVDAFAQERDENVQFSDGDIPCVLWLDASQDPEFDQGSPVSTWADKSSNNVDASPISESPNWAVQDGVEAIEFDGTDGRSLEAQAGPDAIEVDEDSGLTVTIMAWVADKNNAGGGLYAIGEPGDGNTGTVFEAKQSGGVDNTWFVDPGPTNDITIEGEWVIITHTVESIADGGQFYVNGEERREQATGDVDDLGSDIQIGSAGSDNVFNGYVSEYFISNERLSDEDRTTVECAMDAKHDFAVGLSAC